MIKMVTGTYGLEINGTIEAMNKNSPPFSLSPARESELVLAGVAEYTDISDESLSGMKMEQLRKIATEKGIDAGKIRSKKEIIALIKEAGKNSEGE